MGRWGEGRWGDGVRGDKGEGRWGDGEMERWGDWGCMRSGALDVTVCKYLHIGVP